MIISENEVILLMNKQQKVLIESIIKQNPKYIGNENLLEQFCAEVYKKSYLLLDSVSNMDSLKNYLTKVVDTSINSIVKSNISQITLNKESQQQEKELPENNFNTELSQRKEPKLQNNTKDIISISKKNQSLKIKNPYKDLIDPLELVQEKPINPVLAQNIVDAIIKLNNKEPNKKILDIFIMRYSQNLPQETIAKNLKISPADLSKRFCEIVKLVREEIL